MTKNIEVKNFTKKIGDFTAMDNISFNVEQGSVFAFRDLTEQEKAPL